MTALVGVIRSRIEQPIRAFQAGKVLVEMLTPQNLPQFTNHLIDPEVSGLLIPKLEQLFTSDPGAFSDESLQVIMNLPVLKKNDYEYDAAGGVFEFKGATDTDLSLIQQVAHQELAQRLSQAG